MVLPITAPAGQLSITSIIRDNPQKSYVKKVQQYDAKLTMHMTGKDLKKALSHIDYYESPRLLQLRQMYSPSNEDFFSRLHRPIDKIWQAKGGSANYLLPDAQKKQFTSILSNVKDGYSLRDWMKTYWLPAYWYDPMGIIFMEVGNNISYPTYKCVQDVYDMPVPKGRKFDYLVFKQDRRIEDQIGYKDTNSTDVYQDTNKSLKYDNQGYYRVIDDEHDYLIKYDGAVHIIEEESFPNYYGEVPAVTASDLWDNVRNHFVSPDNDTIGIADQHLRSRSVLVMFELHHGFPLSWMYQTKCPTCAGTGKKSSADCPSCNGSGIDSKKDASKLILLPFPKTKDDPVIDKPGGSVETPVDSWQEMKLTIDRQYKEAHYCTWGTHLVEDTSHQETATGRFIDVQPVNDRLGKYSDAAEWMEMWICDMLGQFYFDATYKGSEINLGRRYLVESADAIWKKLQDAIGKNLNYSSLKNLYYQWLDSEYSGDEMMRLRLGLEFRLDPAPFLTIQQAKVAFIDPRDYQRKLYYGMWLESIEAENKNWYITNNYQTLQKKLDTYVDAIIAKQPVIAETNTNALVVT